MDDLRGQFKRTTRANERSGPRLTSRESLAPHPRASRAPVNDPTRPVKHIAVHLIDVEVVQAVQELFYK